LIAAAFCPTKLLRQTAVLLPHKAFYTAGQSFDKIYYFKAVDIDGENYV